MDERKKKGDWFKILHKAMSAENKNHAYIWIIRVWALEKKIEIRIWLNSIANAFLNYIRKLNLKAYSFFIFS